MADISPEQQQEFEFRMRLEQEQAAQQQQQAPKQQAGEDSTVNPLFGMIGGGVAGQVAGPAVNAAFQEATKGAAAKQLGVSPADLEWDSPGQRWARKTGFGAGEGHTVEEVDKAYKEMQAAKNKPVGQGKIASKLKGPMNVDAALELDAQEAARQARFASQREQAAAAAAKAVPAGEKIASALNLSPATQNVLSSTYKGVSSAVPAIAGRTLAGGLAGLQGYDAWNRAHQGDYAGALIGGLGALGSAAAFIPHPIARIGGTALGIGAQYLNDYLDNRKKDHKAAGGQIALATGGLVYLR